VANVLHFFGVARAGGFVKVERLAGQRPRLSAFSATVAPRRTVEGPQHRREDEGRLGAVLRRKARLPTPLPAVFGKALRATSRRIYVVWT
jgi:hypothetical protein